MLPALAAQSPSTFSHQGPLALWLFLQLLALSVPAFQLPLSDQFPRPAERLALEEMLVVQIGAGAILFPLLFRTWRQTFLIIAAGWPFLQLAGFLSSAPAIPVITCGLYVSIWLLTLGLWRSILPTQRMQMIACAIATALTLGGPLLWYLRIEFVADPTAAQMHVLTSLSPTLGAISILHRGPSMIYVWIAAGVMLLVSVAATSLLRSRLQM